ncbi:hypothetical protein [Kibdelosporangium aridum]|uniref:hypothetical protein n=1 Tax=Kibdelosporangium aridum TaxID=2030 RepID=UPI000F7AE852|nr:hypothetical protein [Kibdelosporangium aridum]
MADIRVLSNELTAVKGRLAPAPAVIAAKPLLIEANARRNATPQDMVDLVFSPVSPHSQHGMTHRCWQLMNNDIARVG